jgi:hypothetical protein
MSHFIRPEKSGTVENLQRNMKDELICNIKGVFVSDLYTVHTKFCDWIIKTVETGFSLKIKEKFIFSKIYDCNNPQEFLFYAMENIGMPPTFNQEGEMFVVNDNTDLQKFAYLVRAVFEVFNTIISGGRCCGLKEACSISNQPVTAFCEKAPWKKFSSDENAELCAYCQVWNTFGLSKMEII